MQPSPQGHRANFINPGETDTGQVDKALCSTSVKRDGTLATKLALAFQIPLKLLAAIL